MSLIISVFSYGGVWMVIIEESIHIKCPVDKVFTYTTEAKKWPNWQSILPEAEQTSQGIMCIGSKFRGIVRMMGLSMKWTAEVTDYEPNIKWTKNITCRGMRIAEHVTYKLIDDGVTFSILYDMKISWFMKMFSPMIASTMRKETIKSLAQLKSILETQT